jgi:hypothetical protein
MDADLRWALTTPWVAARLGIDPLRVERLFAVRSPAARRRTGLVEGKRLIDALLEGGEERVLAAVRLAAAA